jgi:Zn-dependent protease with chaperone function
MKKCIRPLRTSYFLAITLILLLTGCATKPVETPTPQPTRDPNLERPLEQQLEGMNPEAVSIYKEATVALDSGDYDKSRQLYEQVLSLAPNFSTAYRRLGSIELSLNNMSRAEELSRKALDLEPNSYNQSALALVLYYKNTPADSQEAFNLASSAVNSLPNDDQANMALLLSAAAINNINVVRQADKRLLQVSPYNPLAFYFAGLLAADDGKWETAETELVYSQKLGMSPDIVQHALNNGIARNALLTRSLRQGGVAVAFWLLGLGLLYLAGTFLSVATIRALNKEQPARDAQIKPSERTIRSIYRVVITILSLYFYVSLPFVILILFLVVGGAFYLFFLIGSIPIQLAIILIVMLLASLFAIGRSLFSWKKIIPPGHLLRQMDAPELWALVEQVARKLGIRPVDSISITPGAEIAVNEKGGILKKLRGAGQRNLLLGIGVLPGLTQGQFAAILAHEYGHFSSKDTAGGNLAYQVYGSLNQVAFRLVQNKAANIFNPVWLFVMGYQRIFLHVTLGASRLQEVLADRYAALAYGSLNCIEGLKSITRQVISFQLHANYEIRKSIELNRPINNLYALPIQENLHVELEKRLEEIMKRPTSPYDSHPAPQERIALIERLHIPDYPMQDNPLPALQLVPNHENLQCEMTAEIIKSVRKS